MILDRLFLSNHHLRLIGRNNLSVSAVFKMAPKRKSADSGAAAGNETKKNKTDTDWKDIDFASDTKDKHGNKWNLKVSSWNVDGLRACVKKGGAAFLQHESPDVMCFQETKVSEKQVPAELKLPEYPNQYWLSAKKDGYSGVALLSKEAPLSVKYGFDDGEHDDEGRVITAEYQTFYLVTAYVPNAGRKLITLDKRMDWDPKFRKYLNDLDSKKPVIVCGDLNVAHKEIDLKNPKTNTKNAGFTKEEREGFSTLLDTGFTDMFRHFYPDEKDKYTFWTYMMNCRAKNVGWRLDYMLVSTRLVDNVTDCIHRDQVLGSDHCPVTLLLTTPEKDN